jgi:hypothetical protein
MKRRQDLLYIIKRERATPSPRCLLKQPKPLSATLKEERIRERKDIAGMGGNGGGSKACSSLLILASMFGDEAFKKNVHDLRTSPPKTQG